MKRYIFFTVLMSYFVSGALFGQYKSKYPDMPIIDVHVHASRANDVSNYLKISEVIKQKYGSNLAYWIGFANINDPVAEAKVASKNRFLFAVSEMRPHKGLTLTAEEAISKVREGYVGVKFWFGKPSRVLAEGERGITRIDDIRFDDFFSKLERANVLLTSLHISDRNEPYQSSGAPFGNRQGFMTNPVEFWDQIMAFESILKKYPKLTIIAAHGAWLLMQDAQIDYLRYLLSTYPNLYVDLAATFQYQHFVKYENLRDFYIEYQDRIVYGTDGGRIADDKEVNRIADRYANTFAILETDLTVNGGFFGDKPIKGLNLPKEVLEKIYYKNALKLYPGLKAATKL